MKFFPFPNIRASLFLGLLFLTLLLFPPDRATAVPMRSGGQRLDVPQVIYQAEWVEGGSLAHVSTPAGYLQGELAPTATINVIYQGSWSVQAKNAFEYATGIWETQISSSVPIVIVASWEDLTAKYGNPNILGSAGAYDYVANFPGAVRDTWYPMALANKVAGTDLNDRDGVDTDGDGRDIDPEIEASFNSTFLYQGQSGWYFGTDGQVDAYHYDLPSVVLHELGHGLGFIGSMTVSGDTGRWGDKIYQWPFIYDRFTVNTSGQGLISSFTNGSTELGTQLRSGSLFFNGSLAWSANNKAMPRLYAPSTWRQGSSYSHLDEDAFPKKNENALMTPSLQNGEWIHSPGPVVLGMFGDLGWNIQASQPTPTPQPTPQPTPNPKVSKRLYLPSIRRSYLQRSAGASNP